MKESKIIETLKKGCENIVTHYTNPETLDETLYKHFSEVCDMQKEIIANSTTNFNEFWETLVDLKHSEKLRFNWDKKELERTSEDLVPVSLTTLVFNDLLTRLPQAKLELIRQIIKKDIKKKLFGKDYKDEKVYYFITFFSNGHETMEVFYAKMFRLDKPEGSISIDTIDRKISYVGKSARLQKLINELMEKIEKTTSKSVKTKHQKHIEVLNKDISEIIELEQKTFEKIKESYYVKELGYELVEYKSENKSMTIVPQGKDFNGWVRTDDFQLCQKVDDNTYRVIEITKFPNHTFTVGEMIINVEDYIHTDNFFETYLEPYGYQSIAEIEVKYGKQQSRQIIAECISETDNLTESNLHYVNSLNEVKDYLWQIYNISIEF